jgi:hypothetical protein
MRRFRPAGAALGDLTDPLGVFPPGYPIRVPDDQLAIDLRLEADIAARKVDALAAQTTQTAGIIAAMGIERYTAWMSEESFVERLDVETP